MSEIMRSAKSGRFVSKAEAQADPEMIITQKPLRLTTSTIKRITEAASQQAGKQIEQHVVMAVIGAYRKMTRVK
jgi:hypothetical protein